MVQDEKKLDLMVVADGQLIAAGEFKSQVGPSFGNNFNNRTEEAIGSACGLWAAYREGAFKPSARPVLGYLMLLEENAGSMNPVSNREPHYGVFPEFKNASYIERYQALLTKLVRERLYDSACFLLSPADDGAAGAYREPDPELTFEKFAASLTATAVAWAKAARRHHLWLAPNQGETSPVLGGGYLRASRHCDHRRRQGRP